MDFLSTDINSIWASVKEEVKNIDEKDSQKVDAFLPLLVPQAIQEGFLLLTANNSFIKGWVEKNISPLIKQALFNLYNTDFEIQIFVDAESPASVQEVSPQQNVAQNKAFVAANLINDSEQQTPIEVLGGSSPNNNLSFSEVNDLNSFLTFENFVIGNSNNIAYEMAKTVAKNPGKSQDLNPLFIYGRSGVGKTHLLRAIENYININFPNMKVIYIDAVEFLNDYVDATSAHTANKQSYSIFRNKYENTNVLLIDDIQQMQGKPGTLDIFFNIFNNVINAGKQVVISSDRAPKNIEVDERYQSRFNKGMTCQITSPEIETKLGIIKSFFEEYKTDLPEYQNYIDDSVFMYIAQNSSSNIRELKSAITKVFYEIKIKHKVFNSENIKSFLDDHFSSNNKSVINLASIQAVVENYYHVSHSDLISKTKERSITYARQMAMYLCTRLLDISTLAIGRAFNRDHSTVFYSVKEIQSKKEVSDEVNEEIDTLIKLIKDNH